MSDDLEGPNGIDAKRIGTTDLDPADVLVAVTGTGRAEVTYRARIKGQGLRGATLAWHGRNIDNLEVGWEGEKRPFIIRGKDRVRVNVSTDQDSAHLLLQYSLDLPADWAAPSRVFLLRGGHLPHLWSAASTAKRSPWISSPDLWVRVQCPHGYRALGLTYAVNSSALARREQCFTSFGSRVPFTVLVGPFQEEAWGPAPAVYTLDSTKATRAVVLEIKDSARAVQGVLTNLFGRPAVEQLGVVVIDAPGATAFSNGSVVGINLADLAPAHADRAGVRAQLLADLAHEYTHSWWGYSAFYESQSWRSLLGEALAVVLSFEIADQLGDREASRVLQEEAWRYVCHAFVSSRRQLARRHGTTSSISGAMLWNAIRLRDRRAFRATLQRLWDVGRAAALTPTAVRACLTEGHSQYAAIAMLQALRPSRPLHGRVRVHESAQQCVAVVTPPRRLRNQLRHRLEADGIASAWRVHSSVEVRAQTRDKLYDALEHLQRHHVLFSSNARTLVLLHIPGIGRLWRWLDRVLADRNQHEQALKRMLAAVLGLALNPDSPQPFRALANATKRSIPALSRQLLKAAERRI